MFRIHFIPRIDPSKLLRSLTTEDKTEEANQQETIRVLAPASMTIGTKLQGLLAVWSDGQTLLLVATCMDAKAVLALYVR
eukprot:scaffold24450_cov122-Cylindrotheca_fusiformis.AAC.2